MSRRRTAAEERTDILENRATLAAALDRATHGDAPPFTADELLEYDAVMRASAERLAELAAAFVAAWDRAIARSDS